jgi:hypothetical protein
MWGGYYWACGAWKTGLAPSCTHLSVFPPTARLNTVTCCQQHHTATLYCSVLHLTAAGTATAHALQCPTPQLPQPSHQLTATCCHCSTAADQDGCVLPHLDAGRQSHKWQPPHDPEGHPSSHHPQEYAYHFSNCAGLPSPQALLLLLHHRSIPGARPGAAPSTQDAAVPADYDVITLWPPYRCWRLTVMTLDDSYPIG